MKLRGLENPWFRSMIKGGDIFNDYFLSYLESYLDGRWAHQTTGWCTIWQSNTGIADRESRWIGYAPLKTGTTISVCYMDKCAETLVNTQMQKVIVENLIASVTYVVVIGILIISIKIMAFCVVLLIKLICIRE